jgi:hypothetical protein
MKLHQILAVNKGVKSKEYGNITKLHKEMQKSDLILGLQRRFRPREDVTGGDSNIDNFSEYPDEDKKIQLKIEDVITEAQEKFASIWNSEAAKDFANAKAVADLVLDADTDRPETLYKNVPVSHLLYLEKQLNDLFTFVSNLPVLSTDHNWEYDAQHSHFRSNVIKTLKSKKIQRPIELAPATKEHPAQVQLVTDDVPIGVWETTHFSAAIASDRKEAMKKNVLRLQKAVKYAREKANADTDAPGVRIGSTLLSVVFNNE